MLRMRVTMCLRHVDGRGSTEENVKKVNELQSNDHHPTVKAVQSNFPSIWKLLTSLLLKIWRNRRLDCEGLLRTSDEDSTFWNVKTLKQNNRSRCYQNRWKCVKERYLYIVQTLKEHFPRHPRAFSLENISKNQQ